MVGSKESWAVSEQNDHSLHSCALSSVSGRKGGRKGIHLNYFVTAYSIFGTCVMFQGKCTVLSIGAICVYYVTELQHIDFILK